VTHGKPTIANAVALAARVHATQRDKAGEPYILHPLRVMFRLADETAQMVGVLHDVLEDDEHLTADDLRADGYDEAVVAALEALTKRDAERYEDFIGRVALNPLARRVKLADLEDNMDVRRLPALTGKDLERLGKYHASWRRLTTTDAGQTE